MAIDVGVLLPHIGHLGNDLLDPGQVARYAEEVGLDSVWAGDHLTMGGRPLLECTLNLTYAAAVTSRVRIGFAVMLAAMRPLAWTAKQLATLQYLSGNRVEFGVGVGAKWPEEWEFAGVPLSERGRRTDTLLRLLPDLLSAKSTALPGVRPEIVLNPPVPVPPIWVGGVADRSLRRAAAYCDGWLTTITTPTDIRKRATRLIELAEANGRPVPKIGTMIYANLTDRPSTEAAETIAASLANGYGLSIDHTRQVVIGGSPEQAAEGLQRYLDAGAQQFVVALEGANWQAQYDLLAKTRALLTS